MSSLWSLTAENIIPSRVNPSETCGGTCGSVAGVPYSVYVFPCQCQSSPVFHTYINTILSEVQERETWEPSNKAVLFRISQNINTLNAELNPICYLLALLGAHHFLHVSRIRVKSLTLRLMSYIYIYMEHLFLMFLDHTQRRTTVGRTPLDE